MASFELNMEEEKEEVPVPDDKDANIELGSLQGSDKERSNGDRNVVFISSVKIFGILFSYRLPRTDREKSIRLKEIINTFLNISI